MRIRQLIALVMAVTCLCAFRTAPGGVNLGVAENVDTEWIPYLDANCVAAYRMNDTNDETDDSGNGNTLTEIVADVERSTTLPTGYSGYSRFADTLNTGESLTQDDGGGLDISGADQQISIVYWFRSGYSSGVVGQITKYDAGGNQQQYMAYQYLTKTRFLLSGNGSAATAAVGATVMQYNNTWYHIACVYNDIDMRIYVNGVLDSNGADNPKAYTSGIFNGSAKFALGQYYNSGSAAGKMENQFDEIGIFNRALTVEEVVQIYTSGLFNDKGSGD